VHHSFDIPPDTQHDLFWVQSRLGDSLRTGIFGSPRLPAVHVLIQDPGFIASYQTSQERMLVILGEQQITGVDASFSVLILQFVWKPYIGFFDVTIFFRWSATLSCNTLAMSMISRTVRCRSESTTLLLRSSPPSTVDPTARHLGRQNFHQQSEQTISAPLVLLVLRVRKQHKSCEPCRPNCAFHGGDKALCDDSERYFRPWLPATNFFSVTSQRHSLGAKMQPTDHASIVMSALIIAACEARTRVPLGKRQ